jgi:hypothetical protein
LKKLAEQTGAGKTASAEGAPLSDVPGSEAHKRAQALEAKLAAEKAKAPDGQEKPPVPGQQTQVPQQPPPPTTQPKP